MIDVVFGKLPSQKATLRCLIWVELSRSLQQHLGSASGSSIAAVEITAGTKSITTTPGDGKTVRREGTKKSQRVGSSSCLPDLQGLGFGLIASIRVVPEPDVCIYICMNVM